MPDPDVLFMRRQGGAAGMSKAEAGQALLIQDLGIPYRNNCAQVFEFQWFTLALEFLLLVGASPCSSVAL
jgi:hypothetical protein